MVTIAEVTAYTDVSTDNLLTTIYATWPCIGPPYTHLLCQQVSTRQRLTLVAGLASHKAIGSVVEMKFESCKAKGHPCCETTSWKNEVTPHESLDTEGIKGNSMRQQDVQDVYRVDQGKTQDGTTDRASQSSSAGGSESNSTLGVVEMISEREVNAAVNGTLSDGMNKPSGRLLLCIKQRNQERAKNENAARRKAAKKNALKAKTALE